MTTMATIQAGDGDPRHGTVNGYQNLKCRGARGCQPCRVAWAAYCNQQRHNRGTRLRPDDPRHGQANTYVNHRCRCDPCRTAATETRRPAA